MLARNRNRDLSRFGEGRPDRGPAVARCDQTAASRTTIPVTVTRLIVRTARIDPVIGKSSGSIITECADIGSAPARCTCICALRNQCENVGVLFELRQCSNEHGELLSRA